MVRNMAELYRTLPPSADRIKGHTMVFIGQDPKTGRPLYGDYDMRKPRDPLENRELESLDDIADDDDALYTFEEEGKSMFKKAFGTAGKLLGYGLLMSSVALGSIGYAGNADAEQCTQLPSTSGWKYLGEMEVDADSNIPGKETLIKGYQNGHTRLLISTFKGKSSPVSYTKKNMETERFYDTNVDRDNDCIFETQFPNGADTNDLSIDYKAWGF